MLDFRHKTFLTLCQIGSYTKTAQQLNMTQPGVTQHIKFLEAKYGGKLFGYKDRKLSLTVRGERLYTYAMKLQADSNRIEDLLSADFSNMPPVKFGATLTIGEYVMPPILKDILLESPSLLLSMQVGNTKTLLEKLQNGELYFALLEGYFNQAEYDAKRLKTENFIPVCGAKSVLAGQTITLQELLSHNLVLREPGSGTRDVLEHALMKYNLTIHSFHHVYEIGNMNAIKQLVAGNVGVSFMYEAAAARELKSGTLAPFFISDFQASHDFSFVFLKNSIHGEEYLTWYRLFQKLLQNGTVYESLE